MKRCGDFGGQKEDGSPCGRPAGWGTEHDEGPCRSHPADPTAKDLTPKVERFVHEYIKDLNGAGAYRRAGFTASTTSVATTEAHRLLNRPGVQAAIQERVSELFAELKTEQRAVLSRLLEIAHGDLGAFMDGSWFQLRSIDDLPPGLTRLVKRVKHTQHGIDFQLHDPIAAMKLLGQYWGILRDAVDVNVSGTVNHRHRRYEDLSDAELLKRRESALKAAATGVNGNGRGNGNGKG